MKASRAAASSDTPATANDNEIIRKLEGEEGALSSAAKKRLEMAKNACAELLKLATGERTDEAHPIPRDEIAVKFFAYLKD